MGHQGEVARRYRELVLPVLRVLGRFREVSRLHVLSVVRGLGGGYVHRVELCFFDGQLGDCSRHLLSECAHCGEDIGCLLGSLSDRNDSANEADHIFVGVWKPQIILN